MPKVKIDGVQRVEDALTAVEAGADFIGLVFVPNRRRRVSVERARRVVKAVKAASCNPPKLVGLFADQSLEEVRATIRGSGVDMVQLCGAESMEFCDEALVPVLKAIHVPAGLQSPETLKGLKRRMRALSERGLLTVLDREVAGLQGGTGLTFDWEVAARLSGAGFEFMLAGGLTPENVSRAVRKVNPWGVDVSSGVESKGIKDPEKIRRFIEEARRVRP